MFWFPQIRATSHRASAVFSAGGVADGAGRLADMRELAAIGAGE